LRAIIARYISIFEHKKQLKYELLGAARCGTLIRGIEIDRHVFHADFVAPGRGADRAVGRSADDREFAGRLAFVAGLVAAPVLVRLVTGSLPVQTIEAGPVVLIVGGLLTGFGSVWGSGCTSGHGVCGLSRLSVRSLVATVTFMATGMATVFLMRHWS
jgi:uncharacterized membrane protein YedE/YeeE